MPVNWFGPVRSKPDDARQPDTIPEAPMNADRAALLSDGPAPKHEQLRALIARQAKPGQAIPSERELMATYRVSRSTVRRAIDTLVADGLLRRSQGKGTFAVQPRVESRLHLASFTQDMRRRGHVPTTRVLAVESVSPPPDAAASLRLEAGERAWRLERVRLADGEPIALEEGWYPARLFPDLDAQPLEASLYETLASRYGTVIDAAVQTLWAEQADAASARHLAVGTGAALLMFLRRSTAAGVPVEHILSRYRGDRYTLHMPLDLSQPATL